MHATRFPIHKIETSGCEPYILEGVTKVDFDRLLACLYPRTLWDEETETTEEWTSILKLASKWGFQSLRSRAISKIEHRILESPIDMVVLGRQYDAPDILLAGYAALCQSNLPLSYEEALHLGMKDVVNIYRIRHELYGSDITLVAYDEAIEKVKTFMSKEERKDGEDEGPKQHEMNLDYKQASVGMDAGSISLGPLASTPEEDREPEDIASNINSDAPSFETALDICPAGVQHLVNPLTSGDEPALETLDSGDNSILISVPPDCASTSPVSRELELLNDLTKDNLHQVSSELVQWVNDKDAQMLLQVTRLIVGKAIEEPEQSEACASLCRKMVRSVSGPKIRDNIIVKKAKKTSVMGGALFREYLGQICQENLVNIAASVMAASEKNEDMDATRLVEARRLHLIKFIKQLSHVRSEVVLSRAIVKKWVASLLDVHDQEKIVTLCILLTEGGHLWGTSQKLQACMNDCFQKLSNVAKTTSNHRVQTAVQDAIARRQG